MKYLVMECKEGYAVLMGEDSTFVKAADLHYKVGQTVTDPVLTVNESKSFQVYRRTLVKIAAAAACIVLTVSSGYRYYSRNMTDTIVISSQAAEIELHLNKNGSVIALTSETPEGREIIKQYEKQNIKLKDTADVANELLAIQIKSGYISSGDTIDVSADADNSQDCGSYLDGIESEIIKLDLKVKGTAPENAPKPPEKESAPPQKEENAAPEKPEPKDKKEETPAPEPPEHGDKPEPAVTPEQGHDIKDDKPAPPVTGEEQDKPEPPAPPTVPEDKPEPPAAPPETSDKPEPPAAPPEAPDKPEPPAAPEGHITPEPPAPVQP